MTASDKLLTICVPTWNRAAKLDRLLRLLTEQTQDPQIYDRAMILVSDNSSTDSTPEICSRHNDFITFVRQPMNIGFDQNCLALFRMSGTPYVLFFSDDDLPKPSLLLTVLPLLEEHEPSVLLYSFIQHPYDSIYTSLPIKDELERQYDIGRVLSLLIHFPKLSTYCIRRSGFHDDDLNEISKCKSETGYLFVSLAAKAYLLSPSRGVLLVRRPLAGSDDSAFEGFRFSPKVWAHQRQAVDFREFREACQEVIASLSEDELTAMLKGAYQHQSGGLRFTDEIVDEINSFLKQNWMKLLLPRYYRRVLLWFLACVSNYLGVERSFAQIVDWTARKWFAKAEREGK